MNFLILKRSAFGDLVHTLPVVSALRQAYPDCQITWITEPRYCPFLRQYPDIDDVVGLGFRHLIKSESGIGSYFSALSRLRRTTFDVVFDFQGRLKSAFILFSLRAREKVGFNKLNVKEGLITRFYTRRAPAMPYRLHVIRQNLKLLELINIDRRQIDFPALRFEPAAVEYCSGWLRQQGLEKFIIVNPFTSWLTKNWPRHHVVAFCKRVNRQFRQTPLLLWGPGEREEAERIISETSGVAKLAPATTFIQLTALLSMADAYIGGDTGPTHLSASLGAPTLYLFGPTDPLRNGPFNRRDSYLSAPVDCSRCQRQECRGQDDFSICMDHHTSNRVLDELLQMRIGN